jgi:hypothetical protein
VEDGIPSTPTHLEMLRVLLTSAAETGAVRKKFAETEPEEIIVVEVVLPNGFKVDSKGF